MRKHGKVILLIMFLAVLCLFTSTGWDIRADKRNLQTEADIRTKDKVSIGDNSLYENEPADEYTENRLYENETTDEYIENRLYENETGNSSVPHADSPACLLRCNFYNEKDFFNSVAAAKKDKYETRLSESDDMSDNAVKTTEQGNMALFPDGTIGGIVPHHLLAGKMIAEFFQYISRNPPATLVIVAPNHRKVGLSGIHTSVQSWATAFGTLEADKEMAEWLIKNMKAAENPELMEEEHSIAALVPFIKYYLPETKIVPILLHGNYSAPEKFGIVLADMALKYPGTAIIASVDFSHYLDVETANVKDIETLEAIKANDTGKISVMNNDNLDSPASVIALINAMIAIKAKGPEVMSHGNSSGITGTGADYTTGYFTIIYRQR